MSYHKATKPNLGLSRPKSAFTIIELLVVIAVIAALAAITVIAYVGITNQAHKVALSSGLSESVKALENYKTTNGITSSETYPTKLSDMTNLKLDNSINWTYYVPSTTDNTQNTSYCLQGTVNGITQSVSSTDSSVQTKPCLENGLVGWWKMNGNANDSSGNNNNGTINGGVTSATGEDGVANHAYSFDGTSGYIQVPNSSSLNPNSLTIAGWTYFSNTNEWMMADKGSRYYIYGGNPNSAEFVIYNSSTRYDSAEVSKPTAGAWHSLVGVFDSISGKMSLYVDGVLMSTIEGASHSNDNSSFYIGRFSYGGYFIKGLVDDVRVYNRVLSASEISTLYSAGAQ